MQCSRSEKLADPELTKFVHFGPPKSCWLPIHKISNDHSQVAVLRWRNEPFNFGERKCLEVYSLLTQAHTPWFLMLTRVPASLSHTLTERERDREKEREYTSRAARSRKSRPMQCSRSEKLAKSCSRANLSRARVCESERACTHTRVCVRERESLHVCVCVCVCVFVCV